jgi:hypothetical protein
MVWRVRKVTFHYSLACNPRLNSENLASQQDFRARFDGGRVAAISILVTSAIHLFMRSI